MKVLFINTVFIKGSTGKIVKSLGDAVEKQGGEYMVAFGRGEVTDRKHSYFIGSAIDRYMHAGVSRITDKAGFYSKKCTKQLIRFIQEYRPTVIHLHNLHGYYLNLPILFRYLREEYTGKIVWTLHDCWAFTGHCTNFTAVCCDKWKTQCRRCPQKHCYPSSLLCDHSERNYQTKKQLFCGLHRVTVTTVSDWLKDVVLQSFLGQYDIRRIYNGVDLGLFHAVGQDKKKELGWEDRKMILSVSDGWNERKGYERLLSVAGVSPEDWKFVVIGVTDEQAKKLPANILGIPRIWEQKELIRYYSAADVFFNPSVEETFGLVTAEAMACNTPAVVFDQTACPELVTEGKSGYVLKVGATDGEIVRTLEKAMDITQADKYVGEFSIDRQVREFLEIYMS